ncbi:MAG: hypothetical protein A3H27_07830 [Acidobacteria bacterium RIFCSPLOWO2_02_FULL_59_13]|nr:MAG: hypothetical protein A3H27_07830 [Acidobacteria bacterium RIFCSPLOWO2_02_FULL_59_13]
MCEAPKALLLASDEKEACILQENLATNAIVVRAANLPEAQSRLEEDHYIAMFCSWSCYLANGDGALKEIRDRYPQTPLIILPRSRA